MGGGCVGGVGTMRLCGGVGTVRLCGWSGD